MRAHEMSPPLLEVHSWAAWSGFVGIRTLCHRVPSWGGAGNGHGA